MRACVRDTGGRSKTLALSQSEEMRERLCTAGIKNNLKIDKMQLQQHLNVF